MLLSLSHSLPDGMDYIGLTNFLLTFNPLTLVGVVPLAVINDNYDEDDETLTTSLTLPVQSLSNQRVVLVPNTTRVKICDNDGITTA